MLKCLIVAAVVWVAFSPTAWAAEGVIVQRSPGEVVIDLGTKDGLSPGAEVAVYRRLEVVHPVTKKKVEDRFPIGIVKLDEVGQNLSIVRVWTQLERPPEPGDFVAFRTPPPAVPKDDRATVVDDPVEAAFRATLGRSLHDRVATWQGYLRKNPESPWVAEVQNELHWLRLSIENQSATAASVAPPPPDDKADAVVALPRAVEQGGRILVDVAAQHPERVDRIRVGARRPGDPMYEVIELQPSGDHNWSGELTPGPWAAGDQIEYFAETIRKDGQLERATAHATPIVDVRAPEPDPASAVGRSSATMVAEAVNFKAGAGDDEYTRFEARYRYAVDAWVLRGFSVGVGLFRGTGASVADINAGEPSRASLLGYGFAELDFGFGDYFGINSRIMAGNNQQLGIPDSVFENAFGFGSELRFGKQDGTKLLVGSSFTETIGAEAWITLDVDAIERVPMLGEVVVTNLPVGENLGVSLNYGIGYAFTDWFSLLGRLGWNARTITHHGPTAGLSTVFQW